MPVKDTLHHETQMLQRGSVPVPDPTKLTTDAVTKLESQLKELFGVRFEKIDKELERLSDALDTRPAAIVKDIGHLHDLMAERFNGIAEQFRGRDKAVESALAAQKESVREQNKANLDAAAKSEAGFEKRIEGIAATINAQNKATEDRIGDIKDRLTAIESVKVGSGDTMKWIFGGLAALAAIVAILTFSQRLTPVYEPPLIKQGSVIQ